MVTYSNIILFIDKNLEVKRDKIREICNELPSLNRNTLKFIIEFLNKLLEYSVSNCVRFYSLTILAPS